MTLTEFYDEVARRADTEKVKINAAETRRVLAQAFIVLAGLDSSDFSKLMSQGLAKGKEKAAKAK